MGALTTLRCTHKARLPDQEQLRWNDMSRDPQRAVHRGDPGQNRRQAGVFAVSVSLPTGHKLGQEEDH